MIDRRTFLAGTGAVLLAAPLTVEAQPAPKVYRIGILRSPEMTSDMVGPQPRNPSVNELLRGLRELGYVYGQHFVTEPRGGEGGPESFPSLAAELVRLQVDVIVANGPMLPALKRATSTIPIVMVGAVDPVAQGFVQSLGHPGGNFTGMSLQMIETMGKRLELLRIRRLSPSAQRPPPATPPPGRTTARCRARVSARPRAPAGSILSAQVDHLVEVEAIAILGAGTR